MRLHTDPSVPCLLHLAIKAQQRWIDGGEPYVLSGIERDRLLQVAASQRLTHYDLVAWARNNINPRITSDIVKNSVSGAKRRVYTYTPEQVAYMAELKAGGMSDESVVRLVKTKYHVPCTRRMVRKVLRERSRH